MRSNCMDVSEYQVSYLSWPQILVWNQTVCKTHCCLRARFHNAPSLLRPPNTKSLSPEAANPCKNRIEAVMPLKDKVKFVQVVIAELYPRKSPTRTARKGTI